jgi:DNA-binding FadR family transcriptional regulator
MAPRLFEDIANTIRRDVMRGALRPGDKLPSERDLAETLNVGRPVVREALRSLEAAGVLEFRKGVAGGAFIRNGDPDMVSRTISDLVFLGAISLENLTEARLCLMCFAARLACERGELSDFDALDANIADTKAVAALGDDEQTLRSVGRFYTLLGDAAHNEVLTMLIKSTTEIISAILLKLRPRFVEEVLISRRKVVDHLRRRDAEGAETEIKAHLQMLHSTVVEKARMLHSLDLSPQPPGPSA